MQMKETNRSMYVCMHVVIEYENKCKKTVVL